MSPEGWQVYMAQNNGSKRQKALKSLCNTSALSVMVFLPSVGSYSQMKRLVRSLTTNADERQRMKETEVNMFFSIGACNQPEYGIKIKKV